MRNNFDLNPMSVFVEQIVICFYDSSYFRHLFTILWYINYNGIYTHFCFYQISSKNQNEKEIH